MGKFTSTPFLILIILFVAVLVTNSFALSSIVFAGEVIVSRNLDVAEPITGDTISDLDSRIDILEGGQ